MVEDSMTLRSGTLLKQPSESQQQVFTTNLNQSSQRVTKSSRSNEEDASEAKKPSTESGEEDETADDKSISVVHTQSKPVHQATFHRIIELMSIVISPESIAELTSFWEVNGENLFSMAKSVRDDEWVVYASKYQIKTRVLTAHLYNIYYLAGKYTRTDTGRLKWLQDLPDDAYLYHEEIQHVLEPRPIMLENSNMTVVSKSSVSHDGIVEAQKLANHAKVTTQLEAKKQYLYDLEQRAFKKCLTYISSKYQPAIEELWNHLGKSFESLFRAILSEDDYFKPRKGDTMETFQRRKCVGDINVMYQISAHYGSSLESRFHWIVHHSTLDNLSSYSSDLEHIFIATQPVLYSCDGKFIQGHSDIVQYLDNLSKKNMSIRYLESLREKHLSSSLACANSSSIKPSIDASVANLPFDRGPFNVPTNNDDNYFDSSDSSAQDVVVHALRARLELYDNDGKVRSMPLISDGSINSDANDNSHDGESTDANSSQEKYNQDDFSTAARSTISDNENDDNDNNFEDSSGKTCDDTDNYADNAYVDASGDDYYDNYTDNAYVDASGDDYYNDSFEDYDYQDDQN